MLYIQHYVKTIHFLVKILMALLLCKKTTKLIEGHRGLQDYRYIMLLLLRFFTFLRFFPGFVRFLELCWRVSRGLVPRCLFYWIKSFHQCVSVRWPCRAAMDRKDKTCMRTGLAKFTGDAKLCWRRVKLGTNFNLTDHHCTPRP